MRGKYRLKPNEGNVKLILDKCARLCGWWHKGNLGVLDYMDDDTNPNRSSSRSKIGNDVLWYCDLSLSCMQCDVSSSYT